MTVLVWSDRVCPACGYRLRMVKNGACGVARVVRGDWMKACPRAVSLGKPVGCPDLQRAFARHDRTCRSPRV